MHSSSTASPHCSGTYMCFSTDSPNLDVNLVILPKTALLRRLHSGCHDAAIDSRFQTSDLCSTTH
jgi:hypothetical protein